MCYGGKVPGLLPQVLQLVGVKDSSAILMTTGPAFLPASGIDGQRGQLSSVHTTTDSG